MKDGGHWCSFLFSPPGFWFYFGGDFVGLFDDDAPPLPLNAAAAINTLLPVVFHRCRVGDYLIFVDNSFFACPFGLAPCLKTCSCPYPPPKKIRTSHRVSKKLVRFFSHCGTHCRYTNIIFYVLSNILKHLFLRTLSRIRGIYFLFFLPCRLSSFQSYFVLLAFLGPLSFFLSFHIV